MKALVEGFMSHQPVAYMLFGMGAMVTLVLEMLGQPSLVFALGMYLPLELNTPALVGGFLSHFLNKRAEKPAASAGRRIRERGVIIASGLMAGGALGGVLGAALRLFPGYREDLIQTPFYSMSRFRRSVSALLFIGLCLYVWFGSLKKGKGDLMDQAGKYVADAVLGIDTLWGGDVMCPSGTGRFIADSWFSDEPLPAAYTHPAAARAARSRAACPARDRRAGGGRISARGRYSAAPSRGPKRRRGKIGGLRGAYLDGLAHLPGDHVGPGHGSAGQGRSGALRALRRGVHRASRRSRRSREAKRERVAELLGRAGYRVGDETDCWPQWTPGAGSARVPMASCGRWARPSSRISTT